jgi:hypothetical protein
MFEQIIENHEDLKDLRKRKNLKGKLDIQVCFDRKRPTIKLFDGISSIELSIAELDALQNYQP